MPNVSIAPAATVAAADYSALRQRYRRIRGHSEQLCQPLLTEDYGVQTMPDVSPPKWHIAHISWFFEAFILKPFAPGYREFDARFDYLFNSYYVTHGQPFSRPQRGLLSRPTVEQVYRYRHHVDQAMLALIDDATDSLDEPALAEWLTRVELGLQHEQQHQELLLTDIKHILASNPLRPAYRDDLPTVSHAIRPLHWLERPAGISRIGFDSNAASGFNANGNAASGFCYDCETPRHKVYLQPHALASRPVSNGEYLEFITAGGYQNPEYWLSEGWAVVNQQRWSAPLYWEQQDGAWWHMTLGGLRPLDEHAPVCHISLFEADAYARWAGCRLPTEAEWESFCADAVVPTSASNLRDAGYLQPMPSLVTHADVSAPTQLFGDVWEWTASAYAPYPGFKPLPGTLGEYNGKFMCSQQVLRGGSCATPADHIRASYRNFFYPGDRWQFSGLRLAKDL